MHLPQHAELFSVDGSLVSKAVSPFGSVTMRYVRSSFADFVGSDDICKEVWLKLETYDRRLPSY